MKSLNVLAILMGEGFSVFYDDADDRIWTRLGGVVVGLIYAALVLTVSGATAAGQNDKPSTGWLARHG